MKCNHAERLILLQDSGEAAAGKTGALAAHLHDCGDCRQFQHALMQAHGNAAALAEPSAKVVLDILREARLAAPQRKSASRFLWKPAFAATAAAVVVGLVFLVPALLSNPVGMELVVTATQLMEPEDQIVSVMYSGLSEDDLAFNFVMTYEEG